MRRQARLALGAVVSAMACGWLLASAARGADFFVISVARNVPMKSGEPVIKDYYINAGTNNGLKDGAFIEATRRLAVYDNLNSRLSGDSGVKIARLKLIHVDRNSSIARMVQFFPKDTTPLTGNDDVMIGDLIQVAEKQ